MGLDRGDAGRGWAEQGSLRKQPGPVLGTGGELGARRLGVGLGGLIKHRVGDGEEQEGSVGRELECWDAHRADRLSPVSGVWDYPGV